MIHIEVITESLFKLPYLQIPIKNRYITGERYKLDARIKNIGTSRFPGGQFRIIIRWPLLSVFWDFRVDALEPSETVVKEFGVTDVLDDRAALFLARGKDDNRTPIQICNQEGNPLIRWPRRSGFPGYVHVYTIIPKNADELYQLWALYAAVISLVPILIKEVVIPLVQWLMSI